MAEHQGPTSRHETDQGRHCRFVEHAGDAAFTLDLAGTFTWANRAAEELSGYSRADGRGLSIDQLVAPESLPLVRQMARAKLGGEQERTRFPLTIMTREGQRRRVEVSTWLVTREGRPAEIQGIARDITERERVERALRESEARYRRLAEQAPDVIFRFDVRPERRLVYVSPAATDVLGYTPEELCADPQLPRCLIHPNDMPLAWRMAAGEEGTDPTVLRCRHRDGHTVWLELRSILVRDDGGALVAIEGIARDITERERLLARERAARAEAEAALNARDELLSSTAHELRTPLTTMLAHLELLGGGSGAGDPTGRALSAIERQARRLQRLIEELLEVSRLELGRLELYRRRFELGELAADVLSELRATSPGHRLVLERADPVWVEADGYRIEQVLLNLLGNAIKFSPEGTRITVTVGARGGEAAVSVRDRGIGIPAERQAGLFERFYRAHSGTAHDRGGMGLGLFICRAFVERHGGRIWCESAEGQGATFWFSLPLAEREGHDGGAGQERAGGGAG